LNASVFDVRYPGETNWTPFASHSSTNSSIKSFDSSFIPPGMDVEFRVRSYDSAGNVQTSDVLVVRKDISGDSDGDGIPDWWENEYGLNPLDPADAEEDWDDDGLSNLAEYLAGTDPLNRDTDGNGMSDWDEVYAGTDPTNPNDILRTYPGSMGVEEGTMTVRWPSAYGRFYSLYGATNLLQAFSMIETNIPALPPENVYTDSVHGVQHKFWRIMVE